MRNYFVGTLAIAAAVFTLSTHAEGSITNGLVAYLPLDGNALDATGAGYNGSVHGAQLTADRFGVEGRAIELSGMGDYVVLEKVLPDSREFTFAAWIRPEGGNAALFFDSAFFPPERELQLWVTANGTLDATFTKAVSPGPPSIQTATALAQGAWSHVALTLRPEGSTLYINGKSAAFSPEVGSNVGYHSKPYIGAANYGFLMDGFFSGGIDEVRLYSVGLNSNEVARLYAMEAPPVPPRTATGHPIVVNGFVVGVEIDDAGYGYTNTPNVRLIGGGAGMGAELFAVVSDSSVAFVYAANAGHGYSGDWVVVIEPPFIPAPVLSATGMTFLSFSDLTVGGTYQLQRSVSWYWVNEGEAFNATEDFHQLVLPRSPGGSTYRLALSPAPDQALATGEVTNGFLVGATLTAGGAGYVATPAVAIIGGGGSNAIATAAMAGGVVTEIAILSAGGGYTNTPKLRIDAPPAAALNATTALSLRIKVSNLAPYCNYQLEFRPEATEPWDELGTLFTSTSSEYEVDILTSGNSGFVRARYVP